MPPTSLRTLLTPRPTGFICRSCASQSLPPRWRTAARRYSDKVKPSSTDGKEQTYTAKYWELDDQGNRVEVDPNEENKGIKDTISELDEAIKFFQNSAKDFESKPLPKLSSTRGGSSLESLLSSPDGEASHDASDTEIPLTPYPKERHLYIVRLNNALRPAAEGKYSEKTIRRLWSRYSLCSKTLSASWSNVPPRVWQILWAAFSADAVQGIDRMSHLRHLIFDMQAAGIPLEPRQHMVLIEALFLEGLRTKALLEWEKQEDFLGAEKETSQEYWEMGVMMLSHINQTTRAQEIVDRILESPHIMKDHRVLLHIIKAWLFSEQDAKIRIRKAWENYVALRRCLGPSMELKDYDEVILMFLHANRADLALAVFKDMMLGQILPSGERVAPKSPGTLDAEALISSPEPSNISWPQILKLLPTEHRNKFFFGKWIKKLLGDAEIDGALQVIEVMRMGGIRPDAKYMNGIVGAWLRMGTTAARDKAEETAWKMIQARLQFVESRAKTSVLEAPLRHVDAGESKLGYKQPVPYGLDYYPRATPETFAILMEDYRRRGLSDRLETVVKTMHLAQVPMTPFLMNQHLLTGARLHQASNTWTLYNQYVKSGVKPNVLTFVCLWQIMKARSDRTLSRTRAGYPSCRTLFAEMMKHKDHLARDDKRMGELHDLIILSFGLSDDQVGTAVAVQAMQEILHVQPSAQTLRSIILQLSKAGLKNEHGYKPRRLNLNSATKARVSEVTQILKVIQDRRQQALQAKGVDVESLDDMAKAREITIALQDLLGFTVHSRVATDSMEDYFESDSPSQLVVDLGKEAVKDMGVPEISPFAW